MKKINLNKGWSFCLNDGLDWDARTDKWDGIVDLPHDFSIIQERSKDAPSGSSGGFFQGGLGTYQKTFKAKKNKKYFFMCDGSFGVTDVQINSNIACTNTYGYNSFFADITEYLRYDKENELYIRVDAVSQPMARWYTGAGLYRDVYLCEGEAVSVHPFGVFVRTENVIDKTAYMSLSAIILSERKTEATLNFEIFEGKKRTPCLSLSKCVVLNNGENEINSKFQIDNVKLWDIDSPNMYRIKTTVKVNDAQDSDESAFGVRTVNIDSQKGFMLNGKSIKLRGGCIHHDQGPLGASVYAETEYRRVARLKEAGFNAIRLSHNPQSKHLYDACDNLGMLVMDELFDYWTQGKKDHDFHSYFQDNWEKWTELIVLRNRCHPSIVMWSTGNEIPQKSGRGNGYYIATDIANKIRSLDSTRPITHALCSLWDNKEEYEKEKNEQDFGKDKMDYFARATAITADTTDIIGYNYLEYRLERDLVRFPQRVIINTETFPLCAYKTIKQQLSNPRIAGDFVWTAWDYFGETGIGHVEYNERTYDFILKHPYHIANCGDIDIIGERKPQSYYREIAWELRRDPYIAVRHPKVCHIPYFISGWGFYDCEHSWGFTGYEGKECEAYVFADCDELVLYINDKEVGRNTRTEDGVYKFNVKYENGTILAVAYTDGKEIGRSCIKTEGEAKTLNLVKEKSYTNTDIVYVDALIQDESGSLCTQEEREITFTVNGGKLLACAGGSLTDTGVYTDNKCRVYKGRGIAIVKRTDKQATLRAECEGLPTVEIVV